MAKPKSNASRDDTPKLLRAMAAQDPRVKVILNHRNFGHIRSPFHAPLQAQGDAVVSLASDLQDPPEQAQHRPLVIERERLNF